MTTITEDYVSFEIAKLLKEKGFNVPCRSNYRSKYCKDLRPFYHNFPKDFNGKEYENLNSEWYSAPTHQMALKWLRETHDIDFDINTTGSRHVRRYHLAIWENKDEEMVTINPIGYFNKWEQACEAAIKYCLEHLL
jgi:hypothetical protein